MTIFDTGIPIVRKITRNKLKGYAGCSMLSLDRGFLRHMF
jgi:hypothetical protein